MCGGAFALLQLGTPLLGAWAGRRRRRRNQDKNDEDSERISRVTVENSPCIRRISLPPFEKSTMSKKAASMAGLSEEKVADLKEAFAMFDINGDGTSGDILRFG